MGCAAGLKGGFKDTKRGGWQWHQTKMVESRACGTVVVSYCGGEPYGWSSVGGDSRRQFAGEYFGALPPTHIARRKASERSRPRMISCFARGVLIIVGALIRGDGLVLGRFLPEPWPSSPPTPK